MKQRSINPYDVLKYNGLSVAWYKIPGMGHVSTYTVQIKGNIEQELERILESNPEGVVLRLGPGTPHHPSGHSIYCIYVNGRVFTLDTMAYSSRVRYTYTLLEDCATVREFGSLIQLEKRMDSDSYIRYY